MITTQRPLSIKQLMRERKDKELISEESIWNNESNTIYCSRSSDSFFVIFELFYSVMKRKPTVLFPEYYCNETIDRIRNTALIKYYRINDRLEADEEQIREMFKTGDDYDFVVAVHFFGKEYDFNNLKVICKNNNTVLLEDAVHVTIPYGKIGQYGDFCMYSPWKTYGLYDGAVLNVNCDMAFTCSSEELMHSLRSICNSFKDTDNRSVFLWRIKKIVQRYIPTFHKKYTCIDKGKANEVSKKNILSFPQKISSYSRRIISNISYIEMEKLLEWKKELSMSIEEYMYKKYGIQSLYNDSFCNSMPYACVFCVNDYKTKSDAINELNKIGAIAYEWPDLPEDIPVDSIAYNLKAKLLLVTVHDAIKLRTVARKLSYKRSYKRISHDNILIEKIGENQYKALVDTNMTPILQGVEYTNAKLEIQGWRNQRHIIIKEGETIGFFTILEKYGFVRRINQGPVFAPNIDDSIKLACLAAIKEKFSGINGVLFFAPYIERNGENLNSLLSMGFIYRKEHFTTGFIDLTKDEKTLRMKLSSKWRNCLKNAEKRSMIVRQVTTRAEFDCLLKIHAKDKEDRKYQDSGDDITRYLYDRKSLLGLYIQDDQENVISFVLFGLHGASATYYVGWSNDDGYKSNASRLLLWEGIVRLKGMGYKWMDLGGIDSIKTKGVAEFKNGTGCEAFEYIGEFMSL